MKKAIMFLLFLSVILTSCSDATIGKLTSYGSNASVKCYSGGTLIYDGVSTGKVKSEAQSDGYFFRDKESNLMKEVSGDCIITYLN